MANNIIDIPLDAEIDSDQLGVNKYVKALGSFIKNADMPMTISIQGEWGSGKTSLMNLLRKDLCSQNSADSYYGIWLNIWKLSLMQSPESALVKVIRKMINVISATVKKESGGKISNFTADKIDKTKKVFNFFASHVSINTPVGGISYNPGDKKELDDDNDLEKLQNSLKELINSFINDKDKSNKRKGFIFFIDDLDRLDPVIAVNVLELLKNIFEVPFCVFVLAIDYDVVVRGLSRKFGELTSKTERQYRSFFDKIIQLPFSMPVQQYTTEKFIGDSLNEKTGIGYFTQAELLEQSSVPVNTFSKGKTTKEAGEKLSTIACCNRFINLSTGSNPRSMIRLFNSLSLSNIILHEDNTSEKMSLSERLANLGLTCMQITYPSIYQLLVADACFPQWDDVFADSQKLPRLNDAVQDETTEDNDEENDEPWLKVISRACSGNFFMETSKNSIVFLLNMIARLSLPQADDPTSDSNAEELRKSLERLLSFSATTVVNLGERAIRTEESLSDSQKARHSFWEKLRDVALNDSDFVGSGLKFAKFRYNSWHDFALGSSKIFLEVRLRPRNQQIHCVYLINKEIYLEFYNRRHEIDEALGLDKTLEWAEPEKIQKQLPAKYVMENVDYDDEQSVDNACKKIVKIMAKFKNAISPYL